MLGLLISAGMYAQKPQANKAFSKPVGPQLKQQFMVEPVGTKPVYMAPEPVSPESTFSPEAVTIIDIGTASNPYGMSGTGRTLVWADNQINAVGFVHRINGDIMAGASIAFDYSFDGRCRSTNARNRSIASTILRLIAFSCSTSALESSGAARAVA